MQPGEVLQVIRKAAEAVWAEGGFNAQQLVFVEYIHASSEAFYQLCSSLPVLESALHSILPSMSFEFHTPLNGIQGYATLLLDSPDQFNGELNPRQRQYMEILRSNSQWFREWYYSLKDSAEEEIKAEYRATPKACQLNEILQHCEAVSNFYLHWQNRPVQLSVTLPENLPPIHAAPFHLSHLISHIVGTMAFELIEYGKIQISAAPEADFINLRIFCTGITLSPAEMESLFEKNGRKSYRQRFEKQGGRIEFSREAGLGAAVHLLITIAKN